MLLGAGRWRPRVVRGGSWINNQRNVRCAYRNRNNPDNRNNNQGFRVVVSHDLLDRPEMPCAHERTAEATKESRRGLLLAVGRNTTPGEYTTGVASWVLHPEATPPLGIAEAAEGR